MRRIFAKLLYETEKHNDCCLVTLVNSKGSSPRGAGSQMLVTSAGRAAGTIGGGSLEKLACDIAVSLIAQRRCELREFRLDCVGMLCGGDVTALFQFIAAGDGAWISLAREIMHRFEKCLPALLVLRPDGSVPALASPEEAPLPGADAFVIPLPLGERAVVFGAGHVAAALVPILKSVDFRPVVFDDRPEYATKERFPAAWKVVVGDFDNIAESLELLPDDYIAVMTNGHKHDFEVERQVLLTRQSYIGVMGSAAKTAAVNKMLIEAGIPESRLKDVHTPIGTAIKAVTPEEIAVSIAGEMILVRALTRTVT